MTPTATPTVDRAEIDAALLAALDTELRPWKPISRRLPGTEAEQLAAMSALWSRGEIEAVVIRGRTYVGRSDEMSRAAFAATPGRRRLIAL
ncbi:hypothetical protein HQ314_00120 [Rhodococcus sp. BP-332]|uniref:hypothetical protein n=1 Tax=Rhodococcus sp. BP-332 TaxID=2739447 RepID=UPI001C9A740D|nr:hypothetical protein [Rhodococcus sp. BP-332]MBY6675320.1 hypothetical protein [Rhodococcus sp. BP-332]